MLYPAKKSYCIAGNFWQQSCQKKIRNAAEKIWIKLWKYMKNRMLPVTKRCSRYSCITDIFCIAGFVKLKKNEPFTYPTRIRLRVKDVRVRRADYDTTNAQLRQIETLFYCKSCSFRKTEIFCKKVTGIIGFPTDSFLQCIFISRDTTFLSKRITKIY